MSISFDGVRIRRRNARGPWARMLGMCIVVAEIVLTVFLTVSIGAHIFFPDASFGATGSPQLLSYEGYLTDASGNPLGGTGTAYCFRFSIYDGANVGSGTKLWPAGTPSVTLATSTDGVFSALIGQADALTYNFYDNDSTYLNVEVYTVAASGGTCSGGSYETLGPRQQIASAGYSISAENVYGSLLQTQTSNSRVQVGTGGGSPTPIYFGLDVKSSADYVGQSCTTSGTVWYNSAISKALVCENGVIQAISNAGATTTIAGINANAGTPATTGTIVFSNSNGVTFGINGNTITASVAAGGGGFSQRWDQIEQFRFSLSNLTNITAISNVPFFQPLKFEGAMTLSRINFEMSRSTSGSNLFSATAGIYSYVNDTQISLIASATAQFSNSATASVSGIRRFGIGGFNVTTFSAGGYIIGLMFNAGANTASMNYSIRGHSGAVQAGAILAGTDSYNTATSYNIFPFFGRLSNTTAAFPTTVNDAQVRGQFSGASAPINAWIGFNND